MDTLTRNLQMNTPEKHTSTSSRFRIGPWPIMLIVLVSTWLISRTNSAAEPVYCDVDKPARQADVVMLSAQWCTYCRQARRFFVDESINYCEHDIENSETGRLLYERSAFKVIPQIKIRDEIIVGYSKSELQQTLASYDLYPIEKF